MYEIFLTRLLLWCANQDVLVIFNAEATEYDPEEEVIYLEDYENIEETVYSLLHECGHFIIQSRDNYYEIYRDKLRPFSSTEWFCGFMREEENAWKEGLALAFNLDLTINVESFEQLAHICLQHYLTAIQEQIKNEKVA